MQAKWLFLFPNGQFEDAFKNAYWILWRHTDLVSDKWGLRYIQWRHFQKSIFVSDFRPPKPIGSIFSADSFITPPLGAGGEAGAGASTIFFLENLDLKTYFSSSAFICLAYIWWPEAGFWRKEERLVRRELSHLTSCWASSYTQPGPCQWTLCSAVQHAPRSTSKYQKYLKVCTLKYLGPRPILNKDLVNGYFSLQQGPQAFAVQCLRQGYQAHFVTAAAGVGPPGVSLLVFLKKGTKIITTDKNGATGGVTPRLHLEGRVQKL